VWFTPISQIQHTPNSVTSRSFRSVLLVGTYPSSALHFNALMACLQVVIENLFAETGTNNNLCQSPAQAEQEVGL
jgi:hypothetical protein